MIDIAHDGWTATVNPLGASLAELAHDGIPLLLSQDGAGEVPLYRGAVLAPWPIRIEDGEYTFDGVAYSVPVNEPERNTALHGLVYDVVWDVSSTAPDAVELVTRITPRGYYPFTIDLQIQYALRADGLLVRLEATNAGDVRAPYGCGFHPYFLPGSERIDDAEVLIPAATRIDVTPDRLLPIGPEAVTGTAYDFTTARPLGDLVLDDMFGDLTRGADGIARAHAGAVEVSWDESMPYLQTFTPPTRDAIALEPCTCPANAFRTGDGLLVLEPGESRGVAFGVGLR